MAYHQRFTIRSQGKPLAGPQCRYSPIPEDDCNARNILREPIAAAQSGFTLIEVVLAIAILAVMMTINYQILKGIVRAKREIDDRREGMYIANSVITRMSKEIQLAVRRDLIPAGNTASAPNAASGSNTGGAPQPRRPVFSGGSSSGGDGASITFMAKAAGQYVPDGGTAAGVVQIKYSAAKDPEQQQDDPDLLSLVREEVPNIKPSARAYKNALRFPISNNLVSLAFRFYDSQDKQWVATWDDQRSMRLPEIVEFSITLKSKLGLIQNYTGAVKIGGT
jgi:prepilin-type N-terminal cleavage/methylation domain-containing protein